MAATDQAAERADLLDTLAKQRQLLRHTVEGLTDEHARLTPTVSELCLGGLITHVTRMEQRWADFIVDGPEAMAMTESAYADHVASFRLSPDDTLAAALRRYAEVASRTDDLVRSVPALDASQPLPEAPWFPPGARWTVRRVVMHIVAETAQHAGHADILRETIDGQKSMG